MSACVRAWRPVLDEGARAHPEAWPSPGTVNINSEVYFEASALLKVEKNINFPSASSEQAAAPIRPPKSLLFYLLCRRRRLKPLRATPRMAKTPSPDGATSPILFT
jgi:hypothetical protein